MRFTDRPARWSRRAEKRGRRCRSLQLQIRSENVQEKVYEFPWEVEVFEELLETEVYPKLKEGSTVKNHRAVSETESVRRKMCEAIDAKIREAGAVPEQTTIYCAYKQGLFLAGRRDASASERGRSRYGYRLFQTVSPRRPDGME